MSARACGFQTIQRRIRSGATRPRRCKRRKRLVRIARERRALVHALHVSTAEEIEFLKNHKDIASVEATTHHLTLSAGDYARLGTKLQMNPPVRDARHRDHLWYGVAQSIVDIIGSDHAPHTLEEKAKPYPQSPSGMTGVQTLVPIMLDHVNAGRLSLARLVDMTSAGPARLFGIAGKGRIAVGYDADFTIVDLNRRQVIEDRWIASRCGWTPYAGKEVLGWPVGAIIRGRRVMWEGEVITPSQGEPVRFGQALPRARHNAFKNPAKRIRPSGQGPWPLSLLMWPERPASTSSAPSARASFSLAT